MGAADAILDDSLVKEFTKLHPIQRVVINWQLEWLQKAHKHQIEPTGD